MASRGVQDPVFRQVLEKSPELTVVLAADPPDYTVVAASDVYLELMALRRDEFIGRPIFDAFPENPNAPESVSAERIRAGLVKVIQDQEPVSHGPFRFDIPGINDEGGGFEERFWSPRSLPVFDDDGEVAYILHRVEDVTDYVMREQSRGLESEQVDAASVIGQFERAVEERSRRQFYKLFMQAPAFIAVLEGPEHIFTLANPAYHDLVGERELVGRSVRQVFPEQGIAPFVEVLDHVYTTGEPRHFEEQEIQLRSPRTGAALTRFATFVYLPNYDLQGDIEGVAVFGFEVTELVEARNQLAEQAARAEAENRHKDEFLAMLGHELRNPMAPIATAVDLVRSVSVDEAPDKVDWAVDVISRQLGQLRSLVDDLLDVARIKRGRIELKRQRYKLDEVIASAVQTCEPLIEQKDQNLRVVLPEAAVEIDVDPARMTQVVANLLHNASKYTAPQGDIELRADVDGDELIVEIIDTGRGIDADFLPKIFNLFAQADSSLDRSEGGLGLGLTLVHKLTEMHGGRVTAHSEGLGKGSRFVLELPVVLEPSEPEGDVGGRERESDSSGRVLVVDDNKDAAESLALLLRMRGNEVQVAHDGRAALAGIRAFEPDYVFLDIGLPEMDGYEVASTIRREFDRAAQPVLVAVTGYGRDADRQRALEAGFDHHLVKPAGRDEIDRVLQQAGY